MSNFDVKQNQMDWSSISSKPFCSIFTIIHAIEISVERSQNNTSLRYQAERASYEVEITSSSAATFNIIQAIAFGQYPFDMLRQGKKAQTVRTKKSNFKMQ